MDTIQQQKTTANIKIQNNDLEVLRKYFSQCFDKNGKFQFDKFKDNLLEKEIDFSNESYSLDWLGKSYARLLATDSADTLLKEDFSHNEKQENKNSENLLIKGDNLEVLKHLSSAYYEKIKMIYIDPPYNTGTDGFIYQDSRKYTEKELMELTGIDRPAALRILSFTQSKSNSHSAWLTFLYPRLYIARQLLQDDGVIFVSIDDNEVAQLRLLMDDIFGEENFVVCSVVNRASEIATDKTISKHEYCLIYAKDIQYFEINNFNKETISRGTVGNLDQTMPNIEFPKGIKCYNLKDGIYEETRKIEGILENIENLTPIIIENGELKENVILKARWRSSSDLRKFFNNNMEPTKAKISGYIKEVYFENDRFNPQIKKTTYEKISSLILNNKRGSKDLEELGLNFPFPKYVDLIKYFINYANKSAIILDFFAGSGTTGDAVMQLNAEDGGNRKYILVQLPELINEKKSKTAFDFVKNELHVETPTIFEITKERLLRSAKRLQNSVKEKQQEIETLKGKPQTEKNKERIEKLSFEIENIRKQDFGFKIFETTPIPENYDFQADELNTQTKLFDESTLSQNDIKAILTTWKTSDGMALSEDLKEVDLKGYHAFYGNGKLYLMNKGFKTDNLQALLEKLDNDSEFSPNSIICFSYNFDSANMRQIAENVRTFANKKSIDIDFIQRY